MDLQKLFIMKKKIKAQIIMDWALIALFGAGTIMSFGRGEHRETFFNLLLVLAWLLILMKDRLIVHLIKIIALYKEVQKDNEEFLEKLINSINEKQTDNDTDK